MKKLKTNRGGSWLSVAENCRAALRNAVRPGFRLVTKKPNTDRSLRGGGFFSFASRGRPADRICDPPDSRNGYCGFRLVAPN